MGQTDVLVDKEQGLHRSADRQPDGRPDHPAQLLPRPTGRAGHGRKHTDRVGADGHKGVEKVGHATGHYAVSGVRASRVRHGRVLGMRGGH